MNSLKEQILPTLIPSTRNRRFTFIDEEGRQYVILAKVIDVKKIVLEEIYITPRRTGGLKKLINTYLELGVIELSMIKVVNAHLSEYLFKEGWTLTSSKHGNWIEFHKTFNDNPH